jgi:hypothetical protein
MNFKSLSILILIVLVSENTFSQDKLFFNRLHYFEHIDCQHPIGTVVENQVFYTNNADNSSYMNFNNLESESVAVDLINFGKYTAFNEFKKDSFLLANVAGMGNSLPVPKYSESIKEARRQFKLEKAKDTTVFDSSLRHIRIVPKDTLVHRFSSYNILINTETKTEAPLWKSPTVYFLLQEPLKDLKGTVVETYFIDLQGLVYCKNILSGFEVINKRIFVEGFSFDYTF